jgi:hypothetical protein
MTYLGYLQKRKSKGELLYYEEELNNLHRAFADNPLNFTKIMRDEKKRLELLTQSAVDTNLIDNYFLFNKVFHELRRAVI